MLNWCSDCCGKKEEDVKIDSCNNCKSRKKLSKNIKKSKKNISIPFLQKLYTRNASKDRLVPIGLDPIGQDPIGLDPIGLVPIGLVPIDLVPYTFRIPAKISHLRDIGTRRAKCPPFHLLLDHVVAVVWCLFSPDARDKKHLGISQLEWALYFLRGVKNNMGKHSPDVAIAIRTIEDTLMKYYADMSKLVIRQQAQKKTKDNCETCERIDSTPKSKCGICTHTSLAFLPRKSKSTNYNSNHSMDSHMETTLNTSPQFSSTRKNVYETPVKQMYSTPENKYLSTSKNTSKFNFQSQFSTSRRDYYKKSAPRMYTTPVNKYTKLSKKTNESSEGLENNIVELKTLIAQLSDNDFLKNSESDDAIVELLYGFRQHQVAKIREQMKKLQSIETLLYRDRSDFASSLLNTTSADTHTY